MYVFVNNIIVIVCMVYGIFYPITGAVVFFGGVIVLKFFGHEVSDFMSRRYRQMTHRENNRQFLSSEVFPNTENQRT